ncbi:protein of unknown function (DUF4387) domain containing protein [Hyaloscypha variabilis]|jgi:hypothetical protein
MSKLPVKILTPVGMMGYGYEVDKVYKGIQLGASAIIIDAGSTDSGPQKLALNEGTCPHEAHVRDFAHVLDAIFHHKLKLIITSAGGDGSNYHVDEFVKIVDDYCLEKGYSLKLGKIYANVPKDIVRKALKKGVVTPCGAVPELIPEEIDLAVQIVAQMGHEPLVDLMEKHPDYDIIISGRTYDPSGYAAYCINQGITNWGTAYHMGKVMECGAQCSWPKSKEALATIWDDRFDILPLQTFSKCSPQSLAAHSLYENPNTELHYGPGGVLDLKPSSYKTTGPRSAGATGALFHKTPYSVKLEGAKVGGNRSIWMGSFRDPVLISQIDDFQVRLKEHLYSKFPQHKFEVVTKAYGKDGTMGPLETDTSVAKEIFLLGEVMHEDQITATQIANVGRVFCVHAPYEGQVSTTGNYAMPLTNLEIPLGRTCSFNIYHLLPVDDPLSLFPSSVQTVGPKQSTATRNPKFGFDLIQPDPEATSTYTNGVAPEAESNVKLVRGQTPVTKIAKDIRSKNAGPYEITFDIIFNDLAAYNFAKGSPKLTAEYLAPLWRSSPKDVIGCQFSEPARAFKFTLPRPWGAGGFGERDLHCSQQHVPLLNLVL